MKIHQRGPQNLQQDRKPTDVRRSSSGNADTGQRLMEAPADQGVPSSWLSGQNQGRHRCRNMGDGIVSTHASRLSLLTGCAGWAKPVFPIGPTPLLSYLLYFSQTDWSLVPKPDAFLSGWREHLPTRLQKYRSCSRPSLPGTFLSSQPACTAPVKSSPTPGHCHFLYFPPSRAPITNSLVASAH